LQPETEVVGYEGALPRLFGIAASSTTWQTIIDASKSEEGIVPLWIDDLQNSCDQISKGLIPTQSDILCPTKTGLFIPVIVKFVPFSNGKREIHVVFVAAVRRNPLSDFTDVSGHGASIIIATLLFTARFQESVVKLLKYSDKSDDQRVVQLAHELDRTLTLMEQEAQQSGMLVSREPSKAFRSPLLDAISDNSDRDKMLISLKEWREIRTRMVSAVRKRLDSITGSSTTRADIDAPDARQLLEDVRAFLDAHYIDDLTILLKELASRFGIPRHGQGDA
jgi:hypothetical protein